MWRLLLGTMGVKSLVQGLTAAATAGFELRTVWSEVRRRNRLATTPPKLTCSELFVERSKKTPSLKSASLSTRRFAAYAYFFEVAWRSNFDDNSWDRVRACKTRGFHCRPLEPGKYATEIRSPRHVQLDFSRTQTMANWTDQGRPIEMAVVTIAAGR